MRSIPPCLLVRLVPLPKVILLVTLTLRACWVVIVALLAVNSVARNAKLLAPTLALVVVTASRALRATSALEVILAPVTVILPLVAVRLTLPVFASTLLPEPTLRAVLASRLTLSLAVTLVLLTATLSPATVML